MKTPSTSTFSFVIVGLAAIVLAVIGAPNSRQVPVPPAPVGPEPSSVSAAGFTLASTAVDLPIDDAQYPAGPHADVINANCTSCHSPGMALGRPMLSKDQWTAEVTKMREVYKAPVPASAVPAIVGYLTSLPTQKSAAGAPPTAKLAGPDTSGGAG